MSKKERQPLGLHGLTVDAILKDPYFQVERDLDCCEFFSGVGSIYKAAEARNLRACQYDKFRSPGVTDLDGSSTSEDICTKEGFIAAVVLLMRIVPGGLATFVPKCASWMFLNVVNTGRRKDNGYQGNPLNNSVVEGNVMMIASLILLELAALRQIWAVLENPKKSYVWFWDPMIETLSSLGFTFADTMRCAFEHGKKGKRIWKVYRFAAAGRGHEWITAIERDCPCGSKENHIRTSEEHVDKNGKKRCTGKKDVLRESGAYPKNLGVALVDAWQLVRTEPQPATSSPRPSLKRKPEWMFPEHTSASGTSSESSSWMAPPVTRSTGSSTSSWMTPSAASSARNLEPSKSSWLTPSISTKQQKSAKMGWLQPESHSQ